MGAVAGADEAEQTPQAPAQTQVGTEQAAPSAEQAAAVSEQAAAVSEQSEEQAPQAPGFAERGRMRRRARFLRRARELAYRDLGGLVFDLHRFGQRNDQLVLAKLARLRQIDTELRELEEVLSDRRPVTVLREVGIAACPRCAAIHGSDDRFCPGCGIAFDANADRLISTAPVAPQAHTPAPVAHSAAPQPESTPPKPPLKPETIPPGARQAGHELESTPKVEPVLSKLEPGPPFKGTAAPVAAKPFSPSPPAERGEPRTDDEEPTRILRPPSGDTGA